MADVQFTLGCAAIAQTVSNNQNTIVSLAGDMASLEDRIRALSDFYRYVVTARCLRITTTLIFPFL